MCACIAQPHVHTSPAWGLCIWQGEWVMSSCYTCIKLWLEYMCMTWAWIFPIDVDECATNNTSCAEDAQCNNTMGSYECYCKPGFEGNGFNCSGTVSSMWHMIIYQYSVLLSILQYDCMFCQHDVLLDIDECELYEPCVNADCINLNGSYTCDLCYHGFNRTDSQAFQAACGKTLQFCLYNSRGSYCVI